ncbi:hypothetical protein BDF20DRAFT_987956 [Mycotypha africana]|uniref:uncharacterized protein n=1 Tax=Mycotypha africana TaxID=64632 RepID=UPI002300B6FC|nr:uncharacterized protein BDF20DRAFT_987956 [Mycotypha africana]KAI8979770.1 hypothetical protein BDF20DRAFT_987956 [Mycotypha africana]
MLNEYHQRKLAHRLKGEYYDLSAIFDSCTNDVAIPDQDADDIQDESLDVDKFVHVFDDDNDSQSTEELDYNIPFLEVQDKTNDQIRNSIRPTALIRALQPPSEVLLPPRRDVDQIEDPFEVFARLFNSENTLRKAEEEIYSRVKEATIAAGDHPKLDKSVIDKSKNLEVEQQQQKQWPRTSFSALIELGRRKRRQNRQRQQYHNYENEHQVDETEKAVGKMAAPHNLDAHKPSSLSEKEGENQQLTEKNNKENGAVIEKELNASINNDAMSPLVQTYDSQNTSSTVENALIPTQQIISQTDILAISTCKTTESTEENERSPPNSPSISTQVRDEDEISSTKSNFCGLKRKFSGESVESSNVKRTKTGTSSENVMTELEQITLDTQEPLIRMPLSFNENTVVPEKVKQADLVTNEEQVEEAKADSHDFPKTTVAAKRKFSGESVESSNVKRTKTGTSSENVMTELEQITLDTQESLISMPSSLTGNSVSLHFVEKEQIDEKSEQSEKPAQEEIIEEVEQLEKPAQQEITEEVEQLEKSAQQEIAEEVEQLEKPAQEEIIEEAEQLEKPAQEAIIEEDSNVDLDVGLDKDLVIELREDKDKDKEEQHHNSDPFAFDDDNIDYGYDNDYNMDIDQVEDVLMVDESMAKDITPMPHPISLDEDLDADKENRPPQEQKLTEDTRNVTFEIDEEEELRNEMKKRYLKEVIEETSGLNLASRRNLQLAELHANFFEKTTEEETRKARDMVFTEDGEQMVKDWYSAVNGALTDYANNFANQTDRIGRIRNIERLMKKTRDEYYKLLAEERKENRHLEEETKIVTTSEHQFNLFEQFEDVFKSIQTLRH